MSPVTLEGDTLGEKRRHFNKLVEEAIADENYELRNFSSDDSDIDNLLKIEIASRNRNVDYIIEVMKSNDMLYAATAIKKSTWLITEPQYSNIINPEYLHTQMLPSMNTNTFNKLLLHIRLNLKDESRVEAFYEYLTVTESAHKWLEHCSIPFIENIIQNQRLIPLSLFKRLCSKSARFIAYYNRVVTHPYYAKSEILFLLKSHTADVLNVLEQDFDTFPVLGKKKTKILLKTHSQTIFDNFPKYEPKLDMTAVMQYLNKKETKTFLCEQVKKRYGFNLCHYHKLEKFISNMPEEERFEFIKNTFIDKTELSKFCPEYNQTINWHIKPYQWYVFAPFEIALTEFINLLHKEKSPSERITMLSILITCTGRKPQHIKSLLQFFRDNFIKEPFKFKIEFVNNLLSQISSHEFNVETWNVLDQLFHSMEVYTESDNNVQLCLESIILYKVLNDEPIPKMVEKKITFKTFENIQRELSEERNTKMFTYLLNSVLKKVQTENIANVSNLVESRVQLHNALTLLRDWNKDITEYPYILEKISHLVKIRQENMWNTDMSCLYNVKKSWRKHMFDDSLSLRLSEETCLNALKHKPQLLTRHDKQIDTLRTDDAVSLRRLLAKLRVYWPLSLARHFTDAYLLHLNKPTGQKAVIRGLFTLFPQNQVMKMAKQYIPDGVCDGNDQNKIIIRKNIAKHLHLARPVIPLDTVLWYAKGDYLHCTVPSLNSILSNMSEVASREHLPKLLDAPVFLQKFGLQLATKKLKHLDQKFIFLKMWNTSQNPSVRSALFKHTYTQISLMAHNPTAQEELWEILSTFIDDLTVEESAKMYKIFGNVQNVPIHIRGVFYMKSYEFLTSLPASANCEDYVKDLIKYAPKIMDYLDEDFVVNKMLSSFGSKFCSYETRFLEALACYVLCGKSEEDQLLRFRKVVAPVLEEAFKLWDDTSSGHYYARDTFKNFLSYLFWNCRIYYVTKQTTLPVELFVEIKTKMEKELPLLNNYVLYTSWKLVTEYVKLMNEHKSALINMFETCMFSELDFSYKRMSKEMKSVWSDIHIRLSPSLGPAIVKCLKEDTERYYKIATIYRPFTEAFEKICSELCTHKCHEYNEIVLETLQHMLGDDSFDPSYFVVSRMIPKILSYPTKRLCDIRLEIRLKMESHPSKAVRMHYYNDYRNYRRSYDY